MAGNLQNVLAGFANPGASRTAILQRMGIDPARAAGYGGNTSYDDKIANLYREGLQSAARYDTEEGNVNRGYERNLAQGAIDRDKALKALKEGFASRGMLYSGAYTGDVDETTGQWDRYTENLGADRDANLGEIGRGRLNLEYGLKAGKQAADEGYGADLNAFLQQQALDLWNSVVAQNNQNALLAAMNSQPAAAPAPTQYRAPAPAPTPQVLSRPTAPRLYESDIIRNAGPAARSPRRTSSGGGSRMAM